MRVRVRVRARVRVRVQVRVRAQARARGTGHWVRGTGHGARGTGTGHGYAGRREPSQGIVEICPAYGCNDPDDLCPVCAPAWPRRYHRAARSTVSYLRTRTRGTTNTMHRGTEPPDDSRPTTGESPLSFLPVLANQNQRSFLYIYRYLFTIFASLAYDRTERKLDRLYVSRFLSSFSISLGVRILAKLFEPKSHYQTADAAVACDQHILCVCQRRFPVRFCNEAGDVSSHVSLFLFFQGTLKSQLVIKVNSW